ncbi:MAG: signal peptidase II [Spirochaetales bacterium]|nr:signal peptidase II [Spirochaetales bacterium]
MRGKFRERYLPFVLTLALILLDQVVKAIVVAKIPLNHIGATFWNDFLWFCHVRNKAIGFGVGQSLSPVVKRWLFIVFPILLLAVFVFITIKLDELTQFQRWMFAGIVGGGIGNLIDRIFRPLGVVDFISVRVFGLFGYERWPTFNIADSSVVVCGILLFINILFFHRKRGVEHGQKD